MNRLFTDFGIVPPTANVYMDYGLEVLLNIVWDPNHTDFEVAWPSYDGMKSSDDLLQNNLQHGPLLKGVFAVADGARIPCGKYTESDIQNNYFKGLSLTTEVMNLLVWNFRAEIIHAGINFSGSWHDSKVAEFSGL